jgi:CBS domain-containing protein
MPVATNEWQKSHPWKMEPSPSAHPQPIPLVSVADLLNPMLHIADVMSRNAPTCEPGASLAEAARVMRDSASSAVFIVSEGRLLGFLTDRTLALAVADRAAEMDHLTAGELMKTKVPMVAAGDTLDVLLDRFADAGAAVVDKHRHLQGVVRWIDLLGHLSERALGKLVVRLFHHGHSEGSELAP